MRLLVAIFCLLITGSSAFAERATFTFLKTVSVTELNAILSTEREKFLENNTSTRPPPPTSTAANAVDLYIVRYVSRRPDLPGESRTQVSGLLAVPANSDARTLPLLSYQHGTVFGTDHVPSYAFRKQNETQYNFAYETRYVVALYAGNGYAVMAADYFGLGDATRSKEGYMMKRSTAQANYDLYLDVRKYLSSRSIQVSKFFLLGWSQGGLNTPGFLELLERQGVNVDAAVTAASPNDPFAALNAAFYHPSSLDAPWINSVIALTIFSCENYFGPRGMAKATIKPDYYLPLKSIYDRTPYHWSNVTPPGSLVGYLRSEFTDPAYFANSAYGKCLAANETYRQEFKTPLRMYYGTLDEVIRVKVGLLAHTYQEAMVSTPDAPSSNKIDPVEVTGADHRMTFLFGAADAMDFLR